MLVCDLVIKDAFLIDGSGASAQRAHVGVQGDRVVLIAPAAKDGVPTARETIDAQGKVLCPGFVDVHSHDDFASLFDPLLEFKALQGVTSEVVGNCGIGAAPFPGAEDWYEKLHPSRELPSYEDYEGYFQRLEDQPPSLNLAVLAGHGALRQAVAPGATRPLHLEELTALERALERALEAGVAGMSAGLIYDPGVHADRRELTRLARRLRDHAPLFTVHLRSEADELLSAVQEAVEIAQEAEVGLQLSHHKAHGRNNWGAVGQSLQLVDRARAEGLDVWLDQYPYAAGSTILRAVVDRGGLAGGPALGKLLAEDIVVASCPNERAFEGQTLAQLARTLDVAEMSVAERILELDPGTWVVVHAMAEEDVETVMRHPNTLFGSDGLPISGGRPHPRLWGTFPRILGHYCRERGVLTLERAIEKMTRLAALRFGLTDRGEVRPGSFADLVLFDSDEIAAGSSYETPTEPPRGIVGVWVNGVRVVRDGVHTGMRPGRALRHGRSQVPS